MVTCSMKPAFNNYFNHNTFNYNLVPVVQDNGNKENISYHISSPSGRLIHTLERLPFLCRFKG